MILKCYFCDKEFIKEWTRAPNGGASMTMFFECDSHSPGISFHREDAFVMEYKELVFYVDITKQIIEIVTYRPRKQILISVPLPETKNIYKFTDYLDRVLKLQSFY